MLAQCFLSCKYGGGTRFTNAAEINEAIRRTGWNATLARNLPAYCEAAEQSQFWGRGEEQGQLIRHQLFSGWEQKAAESTDRVMEELEVLEMPIRGTVRNIAQLLTN